MKVLAITNMYPSAHSPANGVFVEQQVNGLRALGVDVRVLLIDRRREGALSYYRMQPKLKQALADTHPDIVHCMYGGVMARQVSRIQALAPLVITFHGADLYGENLSGLLRKLISRYGVWCSREAAKRASGIVVVAGFLRKYLPQNLSFSKIQTIPCGIDLERFRPLPKLLCQQQLGWRSENFNVLFVAGWGYGHKRPWLAHGAVERATALGIPAVLRSLSGVPNSEVPVWINASDVLILTSYDEASPTIVKECLACNLPIVSVPVGDVAERIDGIAGCYLAKADTNDLAIKLSCVYKSGTRVEGRPAMANLSHTKVAESIGQLYRDVLTTRHNVAVAEAMPVTGL